MFCIYIFTTAREAGIYLSNRQMSGVSRLALANGVADVNAANTQIVQFTVA